MTYHKISVSMLQQQKRASLRNRRCIVQDMLCCCISPLKWSHQTPSLSQLLRATPWWTCGCCSEVQTVAEPRRRHPPRPRCRCLWGWDVIWHGPRSSAGRPGKSVLWLHLHPMTGRNQHLQCSDWWCGFHQRWPDCSIPSVPLSSRSEIVRIRRIRRHTKLTQTHRSY